MRLRIVKVLARVKRLLLWYFLDDAVDTLYFSKMMYEALRLITHQRYYKLDFGVNEHRLTLCTVYMRPRKVVGVTSRR